MDPSAYVTRAELMNRLAEVNQRCVVEVEIPWWLSIACLALMAILAIFLALGIYLLARRIAED